MSVAALQMTSGPDVAENLSVAGDLLARAAAAGVQVAVLPENFAFIGMADTDKRRVAEVDGTGPIQDRLAQLAATLRLWIVAGTIPISGAADGRVSAACLVINAAGERVARYDKIHLFDVEIPERDERYRESANIAPGQLPVVVDTPVGRLGLAVCYDIRFPELFRRLSADGAQWLVLPSAFTVPTGEAHWEPLLRARAIENLSFMVAPGQSGRHPNGRETYGHSMIIDHWGRVLQCLPSGVGLVTASLDLAAQRRTRASFPALTHRRAPL